MAARGVVEGVGELPRDRVELHRPLLSLWVVRRGAPGCKGGGRYLKSFSYGASSTILPAVEHCYPVTHLRHKAQVVGNEHHGHVKATLDLPDELDDLHLDRHVKGARRLVGDKELRLTGECGGDDHPLFETSAQLVRVIVALCSGEGMFTTSLPSRPPLRCRLTRTGPVVLECLRDLEPYCKSGLRAVVGSWG